MSRETVAPRAWPLDLLRIFAALVVVVQHWGPIGVGELVDDGPLRFLTSYGYMGVDVFFFISGLVITRSSVGRSTSEFVIARFGRLVPAYVLVLVVTIGVGIYVGDSRLSLESALASLTFSEYVVGTPSSELVILVAWTLWIEIQFYFVVAIFLLIGGIPGIKERLPGFPRLSHLRWALLVWLAFLSFDQSGVVSLPQILRLDGYAAVFLCGALFGTILSLRDAQRVWPFLALSVWLMWFAFKDRAGSAGSVMSGMDQSTAGRIIATALVALCLLAALASLNAKPLNVRVAKWVTLAAMATYPLYLMHQELGNRVLIVLRENIGLPTPIAVAAALAIVITASMLVSAKFEPPARRWLTNSLKAPPRTEAGTGRDPG